MGHLYFKRAMINTSLLRGSYDNTLQKLIVTSSNTAIKIIVQGAMSILKYKQ